MPSRAMWKLKTQHDKWYAGETISVGIGQGAMRGYVLFNSPALLSGIGIRRLTGAPPRRSSENEVEARQDAPGHP